MFHIILVEPQIPPNTGNIIRLTANTGAKLHLIKPLGFSLAQKQLKRSALDYSDLAAVQTHPNFASFIDYWQTDIKKQLFFFSTKANQLYDKATIQLGDGLVFGSETKGLNDWILNQYNKQLYKIPMLKGNRSLNLSNAVAITLYEAWRKNNFLNTE